MGHILGSIIIIVSGFSLLIAILCGIGALFEGVKFIFKRAKTVLAGEKLKAWRELKK